MALQVFPNNYGFVLAPLPLTPVSSLGTTTSTMDAAGESLFAVGRVVLSSGIGTSKTLSSAGGKIHWLSGAVTFANGSTNLRVGIQDVTGNVNDDTWTGEPQADLVGGTDTITANVVTSTAIESGSRSITHGDLLAVGMEMTARGGADSVQVRRSTLTSVLSHCAADVGSGPAVAVTAGLFTIEFDDGAVGWFEPYAFAHLYGNSAAVIGSGTTPDEVALVFQLPFKASAVGLFGMFANAGTADDFEMILYSDPLGTPVAERTISQTMSETSGSGNFWGRPFSAAFTLEPNTSYAIALRPTTANTLNYQLIDFNTGNGNLRKATMLGTSWSQYQRSDQTGAFGTEDVTKLPLFGVALGAFSDDVGGGGGATGGSAAWWAR